MAPSPAAVRMDRYPVFLLKETIWRMSRRGRSSRLPVRLTVLRQPSSRSVVNPRRLQRFYTAARISSAMRARATARSTTPASTAALGMP